MALGRRDCIVFSEHDKMMAEFLFLATAPGKQNEITHIAVGRTISADGY
jgi:hypothetical protein